MNESEKWLYMLDKASNSKQDFLNYLLFIDKNITSEPIYDEIVSWDEDKVKKFMSWWEWDLNTLDLDIWDFCELVK